ncbi:tRNA (N6-threonylcarbamoyladenosine(37)-N6)-methyltransferase TrmO [Methanomicrobium antiquum]|uniref:tRNA (N6-threonylcarbamoyladenosine(37)-N6)-methyltransferase TrmO n=1 Tax=Methanomicrobium antiquum TaxID=487686 RepID=A0AAF0FRZ6_9EURY|nr:tRNA (N6-threonylcarbamoyladenosine(37)-N6)-methyltransferase TrmO [Methanomicrobium antiquum]MDD3977664.1 tRNA (N6-threonylcarbamoyladenosine(37)-N6)-methyltransferase TrmO [Methanomicrobium sp.]WFN37006.1 tRNA (N6-threonylcarbamoyladenosine(37)-N6)-methyltransferase TrmO [Methanomicrobium antiquum]
MTEITPIGIVRSPYKKHGDAPRQGRENEDNEMEIEIYEEYSAGIGDFSGISHIIILLWFDRADRKRLFDTPPGTNKKRGIFTIRSPNRPNPIGFDIGKIKSVEGNKIIVSGLDALDNTPVVDIKPYVPSIDCVPDATDLRDRSKKADLKN